MKHILFLLMILSSSVKFIAQNSHIQGTVSNGGKSLEGVKIHSENNEYKTVTNSSGKYDLAIGKGKHKIIFYAGDLGEKVIYIDIAEGESKALDVSFSTDQVKEIAEVQIQKKTAIQEVRETPFNVVAIDAKSFYNTTSDLAHMLNAASGVRLRETGGVGSDVDISLNGFTGRHVKVFIDGLPMQGSGSAFQLSNIPATMADRIEVYKGVVPIEFGSDALGGVINIVTNQSANTSLDASYSYGSYNTHRANVNLNHTNKKGISFQLNTVYNYSDNDYPVYARVLDLQTNLLPLETQKVRRFNDKYENFSVGGRVGVVNKSWADRFFVGATIGQVDKGIQNSNNLFTVFGERSYHTNSFQPILTYEKKNLLFKGLTARLTANYNYNSNIDDDTATRRYNWLGESIPLNGQGEAQGTSSMTKFANRQGSSNMSISYAINEKHSFSLNDVYTHFTRKPSKSLSDDELDDTDVMKHASTKNVLGLSYRYRYNEHWNTNVFGKQYFTKATGPKDVTTTNTHTVYAEQTESFPAWGYGLATTYFLKDSQIKFSAEKAVRLPTEQELFGDEIFELGNLSLKPETSYNLNVGFLINKTFNNNHTIYFDVNGYYRSIQDYIMRNVEQRFGTGFNTNHGKARNIGVDGEIRYYYKDKLMLGGTITYMDLKDKEKYRTATGDAISYTYNGRLPNVPYFFGNFDVNYYIRNLFGEGNTLSLGYTLNFVDEFFLKSEVYGSREKSVLPQQIYHNVIATYMMKDGRYNITFELKDIANERLFDNFAMEKPGRVFNIKLRYFFTKKRAN